MNIGQVKLRLWHYYSTWTKYDEIFKSLLSGTTSSPPKFNVNVTWSALAPMNERNQTLTSLLVTRALKHWDLGVRGFNILRVAGFEYFVQLLQHVLVQLVQAGIASTRDSHSGFVEMKPSSELWVPWIYRAPHKDTRDYKSTSLSKSGNCFCFAW